ncbi:hypothetical protein BCh11DRAFT_03737 [Burkholderia sp. Ch1-1]|uniref:PilX/PilW C-terminal domain-containing protein n=1 Tax=Paraburkholderia dioscoreae TaxID=2604047 RepID=A0A5Q4YSK2_9BURK|nr:hypothetical protein BCh11DRAFT_03737 [Burkholderia sp. Ch1-1]VVD27093.1 conserved protein of unknown function [Paraburkholderia dioscoreae]
MTNRRIEQPQHRADREGLCSGRHDYAASFARMTRTVCNGPRSRQLGVVLPIVLLISTMMLATSAAWFETSLAAARGATNVREYLQAFHAADSALALCARSVIAAATVQTSAPPPIASGEPTQWKLEAAFEAGAVVPVAQWPESLRPPQCLVEAWRLASRVDARAYLLTSRGFGRTKESQVWLQMELVIDGDKIERHWRHVASRPF